MGDGSNRYEQQYQSKLEKPESLVRELGEVRNLILSMGIAMPNTFIGAMATVLPTEFRQPLNLYYMHGSEALQKLLLTEGIRDKVIPRPMFLSGYDREVYQQHPDWMHYVPATFHQVGRILTQRIRPECFVVTVSPMDKHGYFSLGTNADYGASIVRKADIVVLEVNPYMPRTFGECTVHITEVDFLIESDLPLAEVANRPANDTDMRIAQHIASRIHDRDTIQLGVGGAPNAVASLLKHHKDLGVHSELLTPAIADLIESGVITGRFKTLMQHLHVYTLALGDRDMYDFMDDNPSLIGMPASWVNNPSIIRQNDNMVSINAAIEVDLSGQINAESVGGKQFSGTGGQLDFVRGAHASINGRSFIALNSTAKKGMVSRIVPQLGPGVVTDTRMDTQFVVTEFGCVNLKGLSLRERAQALISLAHPDFHEDLAREARSMYG